MANLTKMKRQSPLRFWQEDWIKLTAKMKIDKINYQKLGQILFNAYLNDNKEVRRLVDKYREEKDSKKGRYNTLTEVEANDILTQLEKYSPLKNDLLGSLHDKKEIEDAINEIEEE